MMVHLIPPKPFDIRLLRSLISSSKCRAVVSDARETQAKARVAVGMLQLPRTRTERYRHLQILDSVPFDIVPAFNERLDIQSKTQPLRGSIGRVMRRYRKDRITVVLNTMLQACVDKRSDELLWDTIAATLLDELPKMAAADVGIALSCLIKAGYNRNPELPKKLIHRLAVSALPVRSNVNASSSSAPTSHSNKLATDQSSHTPTLAVGGRRHKRMQNTRHTHRKSSSIGPSNTSVAQKFGASEHALSAGFAALHHFKLSQSLASDTHRLCLLVGQLCSSLSNRTLCRIAHYAGSIVESAKRKGSVSFLLDTLQGELCCRLDQTSVDQDWVVGDLCLVAHAYATTSGINHSKALFESLRDHLTVVSLLQLSTSEIAGLANSFSKLKHAEDLGHIGLFDQMGRQLVGASAKVGLRDACVALNAFAQAYVRHEPFFVGFEAILPQWFNDKDCGMRQLSMIGHAYVRVGLQHSSLLPLIWIRAARLAEHSDAHGLSLMLFAITKASAVSTPGGEEFVRVFGKRLTQLLSGQGPLRGTVEPATVAVTIYALVRGGGVELVDPILWKTLTTVATKGLKALPLSEASNIAAVIVQVAQWNDDLKELMKEPLNEFFCVLQTRIKEEMHGAQHSSLTPIVASKLISAFGAARCFDAGPIAQHLARRCLVAGKSARLGVGPLRGVAQALVQLHVHDEDLIQALTVAQKPRPLRR